MIRSLLLKELRQHWLAFSLVGLIAFLGGSLLLGVTLIRGQAGTPLEGYRMFVAIFGVLVPLVVCQRLVVMEYQARTQLFLEGLPFSRWRMLGLKYVLGLALVMLLSGLGLGVSVLLAARHDPVSIRLAVITGARAASYVWCAYSFLFMMGLLGRYRAAFYLAIGIALLALEEMSALHLSRFGPVSLIDTTFAYEADMPPWEALRATWGLSLAFLLTTALLGLTREGTVAALLAERMSHREKVFISALLVGLLWIATLVSEKTKRLPFDLPEAIAGRARGIAVKVSPPDRGAASEASARTLANTTAAELSALGDYLRAGDLPPVFITHRRDLDANRYERGELEHHLGLHVQANFTSRDWNTEDFLTWLSRELLIVASNGRAKLESRRFVLDGFALYWTRRDHRKGRWSKDSLLASRALYGTRESIAPRDLSRWLSFRERVGDPIANAVAWSSLSTLSDLVSPEQFRNFVSSALSVHAPKDLRAALGPNSRPWDTLLLQEAHLEPSRFLAAWQQSLKEARNEVGSQLEQEPRVTARLRISNLSGVSRKVAYEVEIEPAPPGETRYSMLYHQLPIFDEEVDDQSILREQNAYPSWKTNALPEAYSRGDRLHYTAAWYSSNLCCEVISGWNRFTIP